MSQPQDLSKRFQKPARNISEMGLAVGVGELKKKCIHGTTGWQSRKILSSHRAVTLVCFHVYLKS